MNNAEIDNKACPVRDSQYVGRNYQSQPSLSYRQAQHIQSNLKWR